MWTCSGPARCWSSKVAQESRWSPPTTRPSAASRHCRPRFAAHLPLCDFARFRVIDLDSRREIEFALQDLHKHVRWFASSPATGRRPCSRKPVNIQAAERMGRLHDALKASGYTGRPLEVLLVRLLFCLFADDTGIFQPAQSFRALVEERSDADGARPRAARAPVPGLTRPKDRARKNVDEQLAIFPVINGQLFAERLPIADFDAATREALWTPARSTGRPSALPSSAACSRASWTATARRNLGAHYTSEENILKLIGPLFLDELRAEFDKVKGNRAACLTFTRSCAA